MRDADIKAHVFARRCKNSLTGEHKWLKRIGKNTNKPQQCIHCNQLLVSLIAAELKQSLQK